MVVESKRRMIYVSLRASSERKTVFCFLDFKDRELTHRENLVLVDNDDFEIDEKKYENLPASNKLNAAGSLRNNFRPNRIPSI